MTDSISLLTKSMCLGTAVPVFIPDVPYYLVNTTQDKYLSRLKDAYLSTVSNALKIIEIRPRTWKI